MTNERGYTNMIAEWLELDKEFVYAMYVRYAHLEHEEDILKALRNYGVTTKNAYRLSRMLYKAHENMGTIINGRNKEIFGAGE